MVVVSRLIGSHPLLLPTFVLDSSVHRQLRRGLDASRSSRAHAGGRASCQTIVAPAIA